MSYYASEPWQNQSRQASWEHPPSRSGASSSAGGRDETAVSFSSQLEEVERAIENLARSGKLMPMMPGGPGLRRDPMMMGAGPPSVPSGPGGHRGGDFGGSGHHGPAPSRHHSMSEFDSRHSGHSHGHGPHNSSNVQGFYQNQRYGGGPGGPHAAHQGGRKSEADQMHQAQRRMAAQRERELRNYHQEQQYNRGKPERTVSPNMTEEERRDLIARQHRALYGEEQSPVPFDVSSEHAPGAGPSPQPGSNSTPPIGAQGSTSAPRTSTSSPKDPVPSQGGASPPRQHTKTASSGPGVSVSQAPIGTRPSAGSTSQSKRATPPATSPLGVSGADRASSSASNPTKDSSSSNAGTWGNGSGVWGKNPLGVQASVWG